MMLHYKSALYRRADDGLVTKPGKGAVPDPKLLKVTDAHLEILADAVMIGFAYILVQSGIREAADMQKYDVKTLMQLLPKLVQKAAGKTQMFTQELNAIRRDGPAKYLAKSGQKLRNI